MGERDADASAAAFNRTAEAKGWPMRADPGLAFAASSLTNALSVWREKAKVRAIPSRNEMTPRAMKAFLTEVALFEVMREAGRLRFRARLSGSAVARVFGEGNGRILDEAVPQPFLDRWQALFILALDIGGPARTTSLVEFQRQTWLHVECLIAPLGDDPRSPDTILLVAHISPANAQAEAALRDNSGPRGLLAG